MFELDQIHEVLPLIKKQVCEEVESFRHRSRCSGKSSKSALKKVRGLTRAPPSALAMNDRHCQKMLKLHQVHVKPSTGTIDLDSAIDELWPAPRVCCTKQHWAG